MEVRYHKKFLKDMASLPAIYRRNTERIVFTDLGEIKDVRDIPGAEKLTGYSNYYKIRVGQYRIGFRFENGTIYFERVMHRKEIYRFYPGK